MTTLDLAILAAFLKRNATELDSIVCYSCRQWTKGDMEGEAYLTTIDLGDKRGRALDLDDPQDEELLSIPCGTNGLSSRWGCRRVDRPAAGVKFPNDTRPGRLHCCVAGVALGWQCRAPREMTMSMYRQSRARTRTRTQPDVSRRKPLVAAVSTAVLMGAFCAPTMAQEFPAVLPLSSLDGGIGFKLDGEAENDMSGWSVGAAGDVNGDGIDDLIIGAHYADPVGKESGRSYVVFGQSGGFPATLALSGLAGTNGFRLDGEAVGDESGSSVGAAGDINGDGIDDLIVGAPAAAPNGESSGRSYVVFGRSTGFPDVLSLSDLGGGDGFHLDGEAENDFSGVSVGAAGDVNGDGIDDLFIGAVAADPAGSLSGRSYVVFGRTTAFPVSLALSTLDGSNGFVIDGEAAYDRSGWSISSAGDINGDGIDDLVIGAFLANAVGGFTGSSYVVFGRDAGFPPVVSLADLDGSNGFQLDGEASGDRFGWSVGDAGDVNGDGFDDVVIGAYGASNFLGRSYVVFGRASPFPANLPLSSLDGSVGFRLDGEATGDNSGYVVDGAGDLNGDGIDDLVIGSPSALTEKGSFAGRSHVVYGRTTGFPAIVPLADLDGGDGFKVDGEAGADHAGHSASVAGDLNGDGRDDLVIGAPFAANAAAVPTGRSYVVYGRVPDAIFTNGFEPD
jgi:hypothetical protein